MEVDGPVTEVVAAGQRHVHLAAAGQEEPEHDDRSPHALDQLVGAGRDQVAGGGVVTATSPLSRRSTCAPTARRTSAMDVHVVDVGHVAEHGAPLGQQAGHHQLEGRVLGPPGATVP
jgi:hypothetical protein